MQYNVFTTTFGKYTWLKVISLVIILLNLASCGAGRSAVSGNKTSATLEDDIIQYGRQYLGKPYRYAGKGPNSFDCSGYTSFVFKKFGYRLDASSAGQDKQTPTISGREALRKGDLVFFEGNRKNGRVGHVGIVTEAFSNGQFKFIHSSTTHGVIISSSSEPYYASRYLRAGRVLEENASYVTRRSQPDKKQYSPRLTVTNNEPTFMDTLPGRKETTGSVIAATQTGNHSGEGKGIITLVQTDPQKNRILPDRQSAANGKGEEKDTLQWAKNNMALREESLVIPSPPKIHTVLPGETLYSVSRRYGCSVEQLREWNPQVGELLKVGEELRILTL